MPRVKLSVGGRSLLWTLQFYLDRRCWSLILVRFLRSSEPTRRISVRPHALRRAQDVVVPRARRPPDLPQLEPDDARSAEEHAEGDVDGVR